MIGMVNSPFHSYAKNPLETSIERCANVDRILGKHISHHHKSQSSLFRWMLKSPFPFDIKIDVKLISFFPSYEWISFVIKLICESSIAYFSPSSYGVNVASADMSTSTEYIRRQIHRQGRKGNLYRKA